MSLKSYKELIVWQKAVDLVQIIYTLKLKTKNSQLKTNKGFTVIEMLVAVTLFIAVVGAVSAFFVRSLKTQRITVALMAVNDNISLALEQVAREVRTGFNFCATPCTAAALYFTNSNGVAIGYAVHGGALARSENGGPLRPITAQNVAIDAFSVVVTGDPAGDGLQPRITVGISARSLDPLLIDFGPISALQITISPRTPDS